MYLKFITVDQYLYSYFHNFLLKKLFSFFLIGIMLTSVSASAPNSHNTFPTNEAFAQLSSDDISDIGNYVIYGLEKIDIKES